jgi:hypothetical protein
MFIPSLALDALGKAVLSVEVSRLMRVAGVRSNLALSRAYTQDVAKPLLSWSP